MLMHQPLPLVKVSQRLGVAFCLGFFHYTVMRPQLGAEARGHLEPVRHALPGDVQLWRVDLDAYAEAAALDGLTADEHARAARFALERDGRRYLAARHALRRVLAQALGRSPEDLVIEPDELGKPHLLPHGGLHFNLSHSAHEALIGLQPGPADRRGHRGRASGRRRGGVGGSALYER